MRRLYWGGYFVGCSDDGGSSKYYYLPTEDSLPAPVGISPFKTGFYEWNEVDEWNKVYVDTAKRTITSFIDDYEAQVEKYTYNGITRTLTTVLCQSSVPNDSEMYLQAYINDKDYTGGYKLVGKEEYADVIPYLLENLKPYWKRDRDLFYRSWQEYYNDMMEGIEDFDTKYTFHYTVSADGNTVSWYYDGDDDEEDDEPMTLTFLHE